MSAGILFLSVTPVWLYNVEEESGFPARPHPLPRCTEKGKGLLEMFLFYIYDLRLSFYYILLCLLLCTWRCSAGFWSYRWRCSAGFWFLVVQVTLLRWFLVKQVMLLCWFLVVQVTLLCRFLVFCCLTCCSSSWVLRCVVESESCFLQSHKQSDLCWSFRTKILPHSASQMLQCPDYLIWADQIIRTPKLCMKNSQWSCCKKDFLFVLEILNSGQNNSERLI